MNETRARAVFLQDDPRFNRQESWPAGLFPDASYRYFREAGCLVCSLAMMLLRSHPVATGGAKTRRFYEFKKTVRLI